MPAEPQKEASKKTLSKSSTGSCITSICMDLRYVFSKMPVFLPTERLMISFKTLRFPTQSAWRCFFAAPGGFFRGDGGVFLLKSFVKKRSHENLFIQKMKWRYMNNNPLPVCCSNVFGKVVAEFFAKWNLIYQSCRTKNPLEFPCWWLA